MTKYFIFMMYIVNYIIYYYNNIIYLYTKYNDDKIKGK